MKLQRALENKLDWGSADQWHSSMFNDLSDAIFKESSVMLSPVTLKRFFRVVNHKGSPSITTLDTLSRFLGFENYRSFKVSSSKNSSKARKKIPRRSFYITVGFLLALSIGLIISNTLPKEIILLEEIKFSSRPLTNTYPNTVIFDFDLANVSSNELRIQQYWDASKTIVLKEQQTLASGIYYFPGYFRAKLIAGDQILKEHELFLKSDGWLGLIEYEPIPKYFEPQQDQTGRLQLPELLQEEVRDSKEPLITSFHYIDDLGNISADNFSLTSSIKTLFNEKWAVCNATSIYIIGSKGAMIVPVSKLGCSSDNKLMLNDIYRNGKEFDLSAFSADLSALHQLTVSVTDQHFEMSIDGRVVFQTDYYQPMGKLVGIRYKFVGIGTVQNFTLSDQNGELVLLDKTASPS